MLEPAAEQNHGTNYVTTDWQLSRDFKWDAYKRKIKKELATQNKQRLLRQVLTRKSESKLDNQLRSLLPYDMGTDNWENVLKNLRSKLRARKHKSGGRSSLCTKVKINYWSGSEPPDFARIGATSPSPAKSWLPLFVAQGSFAARAEPRCASRCQGWFVTRHESAQKDGRSQKRQLRNWRHFFGNIYIQNGATNIAQNKQ